MNESDVLLLQSLATRDAEVEQLLRRHREFEEKLAGFEQHKWLSPDEQREVKRLKRLKLAGRDRLQELLAAQRASA
jgi:uncharacterized protein YdcH (DUF465 family)